MIKAILYFLGRLTVKLIRLFLRAIFYIVIALIAIAVYKLIAE